MISWKLFVHVLRAKNTSEHAVFLREVDYIPIWHDWLQRLERTPGLRAALILGSAIIWTVGVLYVNNLLFVVIPLLLFFNLATGLSLGPLVPAEREKQRWDMLLLVPDGAEMVLLAKMGGALWRMRHLMLTMIIVLIIAAMGVGTVTLILFPAERAKADWSEVTVCGALTLFVFLGGFIFVVDRLQQYLLVATAAVVGGASAANSRMGLLAGGGAVLFMWFLEIIATGTIMLLQRNEVFWLERGQILSWATLGPMVSYILKFDLGWAILYIAVTLLVREIVLTGLWRWALHQARP